MKTSDPPRLASRFARCLLLASLPGVFAACSSANRDSTPHISGQYYPAGNPAAVKILRTEPLHSHVQVGEIQVETSTSQPQPVAKVEARLRNEAAKLGADAVVIILDQGNTVSATGGRWSRNATTVTHRKVIGVAIKYRSL